MDEEKHPDQMTDEQTDSNSYIAFNGLDYMMLHNLYYIAFRKEDIRALKITNSDITRRTYSQRAGTIETNSSILGNNVTYSARKQVKLMPGFRSNTGFRTFKATIAAPRQGNYDGSEYILSHNTNSSNPAMMRKRYYNTDNKTKVLVQDNPSMVESLQIFPNPCRGKLAISVNHLDEPFEYILTNMNGSVVFKDRIATNHQIIDLTALPKGVYFISLNIKDKTETRKIILI